MPQMYFLSLQNIQATVLHSEHETSIVELLNLSIVIRLLNDI